MGGPCAPRRQPFCVWRCRVRARRGGARRASTTGPEASQHPVTREGLGKMLDFGMPRSWARKVVRRTSRDDGGTSSALRVVAGTGRGEASRCAFRRLQLWRSPLRNVVGHACVRRRHGRASRECGLARRSAPAQRTRYRCTDRAAVPGQAPPASVPDDAGVEGGFEDAWPDLQTSRHEGCSLREHERWQRQRIFRTAWPKERSTPDADPGSKSRRTPLAFKGQDEDVRRSDEALAGPSPRGRSTSRHRIRAPPS